jgi:REP element-mobilizing transposase RayT
MGRPLRWLRPKTLHFVTNRCYQRRFLLRPDPDANAIFLLALGRALRRYTGVQLKAAVTVSNHFHLLLSDERSQLSDFMRDFETAVAKGINQHRDREGHVFDRRFSAEPVLDTAAAIRRVIYTVLNPVKAGLVAKHEDWPGVLLFCREAVTSEHRLRWFNERRYQEAVREALGSDHVVDRGRFWEEEAVTVHPLDGLAEENTTSEKILERIRAAEDECARDRDGRPVLGAATVVRQDPRAKPKRSNRSPRPLCHASSDVDYESYREVFREFCKRFWAAAESLRHGQGHQTFPAYSFPPWKPLVLPKLSTA